MGAEQAQRVVSVPRRSRRRFIVTEVILLGSLYGLYTLARNLAKENLDQAGDFAHKLVGVEHIFAIAVEPQINHWVDARAWIAVPLCFWYASFHYIVTPSVLVLVARKRPDLYGSARTSIVLATLVALIMYWTLPTTPPRLLGVNSYVDTMEQYANWGWWGAHASAPGPASWTNEYAAFPSMHAGWAVWVAIQLTRLYPRRWPAVLGWFYALGTGFVVVGTGNHYVIDVLAGAAIVGLTHLASKHLSVRHLMWGNASRDELVVDLRKPAVARKRLDRCRRPGPVDLRRPRRRELDRFLDDLQPAEPRAPESRQPESRQQESRQQESRQQEPSQQESRHGELPEPPPA
jgi:PAP2 superfamily